MTSIKVSTLSYLEIRVLILNHRFFLEKRRTREVSFLRGHEGILFGSP
jgi:hypothetical protein